MAVLTEEEKKDECIAHAIEMTSAWNTSDYYRVFKLFRSAPKMSAFLVSWFLDRERRKALRALVKAYVFNTFYQFHPALLVLLFSLVLVYFHYFSIHCSCKKLGIGQLLALTSCLKR